jgi:hypothetical protein
VIRPSMFGLLATVVCAELLLRRRKLHAGLARVVALWGLTGIAGVCYVAKMWGSGAPAFALFWAGAFLSWFGVRGHLESSILLRMLVLLRHGPMTGADLTARYEAGHGVGVRTDDLLQGGLVRRDGDGLEVTRKGRSVLAFARRLG